MADPRSAIRAKMIRERRTTNEATKDDIEKPDKTSEELFFVLDGKFHCKMCTYSVTRPAFLVKHSLQKHGQAIVIEFSCKCGKKFLDTKVYNKHAKICKKDQ